ncbi:hypothetical protein [Paraburkholderia humisilvae]|uniref:Uncharacterized protein n=1 Tax=Paraburkholderia humisilvae TaxID=627669 RepID=A0A6J5DTP7_9BURK|nr:hypothetical protein [Paraburkholderia humisilvae]CAB3756286.1 hypothetical protein LMG29542_02827 [Paraburkholderia humisilvae]
MSFRWDPLIPDERPEAEPLSVWVYVVLFLVIESVAFALTVVTWPTGVPAASSKFVLYALAVPVVAWFMLSAMLYLLSDEKPAFSAAVRNACRWHLVTDWQHSSRTGVAILDSVILAPEPDLAERMLGLEGNAPENPGRVMALDDVAATEGVSRESALAEKLMAPLASMLARAMLEDSFEIVMQCDRQEMAGEVRAAWARLDLPKNPRIRWIDNSQEMDFAGVWFADDHRALPYTSYFIDQTPGYRLLLAWHLNEAGSGEQDKSEVAVALLVASRKLIAEQKNKLRPQAWLLRQIVGDADQVDMSLALLLKAEQVPEDRVHHFWRSRLKGLAQHATMGAVKNCGLALTPHELDHAVGPQAPVARWVVQALAAKMAHYGQGPQLVALPRERGVVLNFVAKEPSSVNVPWKERYDANLFPAPELIACFSLWALVLLMSPSKEWGTFEAVFTCTIVVTIILCFVWRFWEHRLLVNDFWEKYGGQT